MGFKGGCIIYSKWDVHWLHIKIVAYKDCNQVKYQFAGEDKWENATTVNASIASGLLMASGWPLRS